MCFMSRHLAHSYGFSLSCAALVLLRAQHLKIQELVWCVGNASSCLCFPHKARYLSRGKKRQENVPAGDTATAHKMSSLAGNYPY